MDHRADYQCIFHTNIHFLKWIFYPKTDNDFFNYDFFINWDGYMNCVTSMKRMDDFLEEYLRWRLCYARNHFRCIGAWIELVKDEDSEKRINARYTACIACLIVFNLKEIRYYAIIFKFHFFYWNFRFRRLAVTILLGSLFVKMMLLRWEGTKRFREMKFHFKHDKLLVR